METIVNRADLVGAYRDMMETEAHHDHPIVRDASGVLRWKEGAASVFFGPGGRISLNDLLPLLSYMGYGKNSEVYRKLYRDMGYSLSGYWEIFYWDANNPHAQDYKPNPAALPQP